MSRLPLDTGTLVSAGAHGVLLVWLVVGTVFRTEPLPMEVQPVSVISSEEFAALTTPAEIPVASPATPEVAPEVSEPVVEVPTPEPTPPAPEPPAEDVAVLPPEPATPPAPIDRVAPEAVPEPEPEAQDGPDRQEAIVEDATGDTEAEPQEATAPEAATTEIVTEADETSPAPGASLRPRPRPTRPVQTAQPEPEPVPQSDPVADAIAQALENQATPPTPPTDPTAPTVPNGPPLTGGELEGLRVSVSQCWGLGHLSTEAQSTRVTVYMAMNEDGTPQVDTIRMIGSQGGSSAAAELVFQTARRAIIRCGARGFPLPPEKFGQWREIEMTFDPEEMFWR